MTRVSSHTSFALFTAFLLSPGAAFGQITILQEDFEQGISSWTQLSEPLPTNNNTPVVFDNTGDGPAAGTDDDIHGNNTGYPGSQAVGFSSNLDGYDGMQPQWIQKQWQALLAPGEYDVMLLVDRYVYLDSDDPPDGPGDEDYWGLGDRIYVLTDGKYDNPTFNYDGDMGDDGSRWSKWAANGTGVWEIAALKRGQDIQTTSGNLEIRLLMHEKAAHYNTVAWDNLTVTLRDSTTGDVVFTYPSNVTGSISTWTDADNVVVNAAGHGLAVGDFADVSWNGGIRRTTVSAVNGDDVTLGGTSGADDPLPAQGTAVVVTKPEGFEDGLTGWTTELWGGGQSNDVPETFTATDPELYWNVDNPGSTSAGYSSNMGWKDYTDASWMQKQFPAAVAPGSYSLKWEFDAYVYRYPQPNYDEFDVFPSDGSGIYGANTGYPGSQSIGTSYDPPAHDGTQYVWAQQLHPAAVPADSELGTTYDVQVEADVYVYGEFLTGSWQAGSRILVLTDDNYDKPNDVDPDSGETGELQRVSTWNQDSAGTWVHVSATKSITTSTGNIEVRLVAQDKMQVSPGEFTIAWDNVSFTISEAGGGPVVYTIQDDFETGLGAWDVKVRNSSDPWGVGNRMYVLTDLFYDDPTYNVDNDPDPYGVTRAFWPGWRNDTYDWSYNGVWQHVVLEQPFTTSTGDIEVRLLLHDKAPGAQAVAWDNLTLTLDEPLGACCLPNATCVEVTQSECVNDLNGRFQGVFTTCDDPELTCCPDPFADIDTDGDVDHSDFALMQLCFTGPNAAGDPLPAGCECVDHNTDGAIDSADMGYFSQCVSGPYVDADLTCDD